MSTFHQVDSVQEFRSESEKLAALTEENKNLEDRVMLLQECIAEMAETIYA